jgi:hypothetical protein
MHRRKQRKINVRFGTRKVSSFFEADSLTAVAKIKSNKLKVKDEICRSCSMHGEKVNTERLGKAARKKDCIGTHRHKWMGNCKIDICGGALLIEFIWLSFETSGKHQLRP